MFSLSLFSPPSWIGRPEASTWNFTTSESAEFDALVFAAGKGSFYVTDDDDSDGIVHEILYVGAGLTKSKGPIPFGIGGSFSTPDMPSSGIGPIVEKPGRKLKLSDFGGSGLIFSAAGGAGKGKDYASHPVWHSSIYGSRRAHGRNHTRGLPGPASHALLFF